MNTPTADSQTSAIAQLTFEEILEQHVPVDPAYSSSDEYVSRLLRGRVITR